MASNSPLEMMSSVEDEAPIIPADLAIQAMRDSGYKNTAYALAELIDNSVQAKARTVEIFCLEGWQQLTERQRRRITSVAVLDDGDGMSADTLRKALQFGNGTRLQDRSGIGRFGMGLPNASISQAGRVDVWTWQNGPANALYTYLDIDEVRSRTLRQVPRPIPQPVPQEWRERSDTFDRTGTLVVWSKLTPDRLTWKGAKATLKHTATLVGRIHRRFIGNRSLVIRMIGGLEEGPHETSEVQINDPLYLTPAPRLPAPYNTTPMFELLYKQPFEITVNDVPHKVTVTYSRASQSTIDNAGTSQRGDTLYGKDAADNVGVSVMRAGRELMLDRSWTNPSEPRDRWWGCEVEFPPALDEIFGVTNNKQNATIFTELSSLDWKDLREGDETLPEVIDRLVQEGDPKGSLLRLSEAIKRTLGTIRSEIKVQGRTPGKSRKRHDLPDPVDDANERWKSRDQIKPIPGEPSTTTPEDLKDVVADATATGDYTPEQAEELVVRIKEEGLKVVFLDKTLGGTGELFSVVVRGTITEVVFNTRHPAFGLIFDFMSADEDLEALSSSELQDRLVKASSALRMLFTAWARMEREDPHNLKMFERVRESWGRLARDFLEPIDLSDLT